MKPTLVPAITETELRCIDLARAAQQENAAARLAECQRASLRKRRAFSSFALLACGAALCFFL